MSNFSITPVSLSSLLSELSADRSLTADVSVNVGSDLGADASADGALPDADTLGSSGPGDAADRLSEGGLRGLSRAHLSESRPAGPNALQAMVAADGPVNASTLQELAQSVPHHDITSERHGPRADSPSVASAPTPQSLVPPRESGGMPASSMARPDGAGANPVAREAQLTMAAALTLHLQPSDLRSTLFSSGSKPRKEEDEEDGEDSQRRHRRRGSPDTESDDDEGGGLHSSAHPFEGEAGDDAGDHPGGEPPPDAAGGSPGGDANQGLGVEAALYQQILAALHGLGDTEGPVFDVLEELRRQRRVVIATPSGLVAGLRSAAHIDVLLPAPGGGRALRLSGELLWAKPRFENPWMLTHLVKSQSHGGVRHLAPVPSEAGERRIAVCLGAQATPMVAWSHACLRVRDGTRLWRALEPQWSLRLMIGTQPLNLQNVASSFFGASPHAA